MSNAQKAGELDNVKFMLNFDMTNDPRGFSTSREELEPLFKSWGSHVQKIDSGFVNMFLAGASLHSDHQPFMLQGIPTGGGAGGRLPNNSGPYYHSDGDVFKLVDEQGLKNTVRYGAMLAYALSNVEAIPVARMTEGQIKKFLEAGGTVVTIGNSTNLAYHLNVPVSNALTEMSGGQERPLPGEKFYIPGSILSVSVDSTQTAAWGMGSKADVYFDASPVFRILPQAVVKREVQPIAWFSSVKPLRSGWAWGQAYLQDGVAAFVANVGAGKLFAFGPEITFRAQTHGTFKLLFNELYKYGN
ncbi:MAG: M28 family peptidase [Chitinophagaceae bacterium]|nr:MAG: M28 family peptidase [Chitinophagaceae bacterium]